MQQELYIAIIAGLGGMLGWGFADFFAKLTIDKIGAIASLVWAHVFGTFILFSIVLFQIFVLRKPIGLPDDSAGWIGLIIFGVLQAIVYLLVYIAFGKGKIAVLNPVFSSYAGIAAFVSILFLGEIASINRLIFLGVIFLGIMLISVDIKGLRSKQLNIVPGLTEIILAALLAAFWTLGWDIFIGGKDFVSFAFFMYTFMTITALIISRAKNTNLNYVPKGVWKFLILIGLTEVIAYLFISFGFSTTSLTSIVALISGSFALITVALAHIFLKERLNKIQKFGFIAIIVGIIFLSIY